MTKINDKFREKMINKIKNSKYFGREVYTERLKTELLNCLEKRYRESSKQISLF